MRVFSFPGEFQGVSQDSPRPHFFKKYVSRYFGVPVILIPTHVEPHTLPCRVAHRPGNTALHS